MGGRSSNPFRRQLNGMPDLGQSDGWTVKQWRKAPARMVRLTDLIATNRDAYLDEELVRKYMRSGVGGDLCVVEHAGCLYLADGHHRATAAHRHGETHAQARVMIQR